MNVTMEKMNTRGECTMKKLMTLLLLTASLGTLTSCVRTNSYHAYPECSKTCKTHEGCSGNTDDCSVSFDCEDTVCANGTAVKNNKLHIVTTDVITYDLVRNIAGSSVELTYLDMVSVENNNKIQEVVSSLDVLMCKETEESFYNNYKDSFKPGHVKCNTDVLLSMGTELDMTTLEQPIRQIAILLQENDKKNTEVYHANAMNYIRQLSAIEEEFVMKTQQDVRETLSGFTIEQAKNNTTCASYLRSQMNK